MPMFLLVHLIFFNDSSHGVAIIFGFANYSNFELANSRSNVVEGAK
jgi:hypothetical protein